MAVASAANDRFTGTLNGDISLNDRLEAWGDGCDLIAMYGTPTAPARANDHLTDGRPSTRTAPASRRGRAGLELRRAGGNDRIFVDYRGGRDGVLDLDLEGYWGDDTVSAVVSLLASSDGQVGGAGTPATGSDGAGPDTLTFHVFDDGSNSPVFARNVAGRTGGGRSRPIGVAQGTVAHAGGLEVYGVI